jgi:GNAT superfamily N-acetyltransferase
MAEYKFRKALLSDKELIWNIIQGAILRRKADGSNQWQDGYPNIDVIENDVNNNYGFVLTLENEVIGYCAVLINDEPQYENIEGKWLTNSDFVVVHRIAIAKNHLGKGLAKLILKHIEEFALANTIFSIKVDTNFDNQAMINTFEKIGYVYCGQVYFRNSPRRAYEKVIDKTL